MISLDDLFDGNENENLEPEELDTDDITEPDFDFLDELAGEDEEE